MRAWQKPWAVPAALFAFATVLFVAGLGHFGLWDPHEVSQAQTALELARTGVSTGLATQPPLGPWLSAVSVKLFGGSEFAARLPFALSALAALAAIFCLADRARGRRAAVLSTLTLLGAPLFLLQARQLTSDMPAIAATAWALWGAWGLLDAERRRPLLHGAVVVVALVAGLFSQGALLTVCPPLLALGLAAWLRPAAINEAAPTAHRNGERWLALAAGLLGLGVLCAVVGAFFDIVPAASGDFAVAGKTLAAAKETIPWAGGKWLVGAPHKDATFDALVGQIAFGMFPLSALLPLALLWPLAAPRDDKDSHLGGLLLAWAVLAYVASAITLRELGPLRTPLLPVLALAVGFALDRILAERSSATQGPELRLAALFGALLAVQLGRDLSKEPGHLVLSHITSALDLPEGGGLPKLYLVLGLFTAALIVVALGVPRSAWFGRLERIRPYTRFAIPALTVGSTLLALVLAWFIVPRLSRDLSYKHVFQAASRAGAPKTPLGVMGVKGAGPAFYSGGTHQEIGQRKDLVDFLLRPERVLAVMESSELCAVMEETANRGASYHVLDAESARYMLVTNTLETGETDRNPLAQAFSQSLPKIQTPISAVFDDTLELIGYDLPERVQRGRSFRMSLYYKVLKKPTRDYKIFVHFDARGSRFNSDHDPILGRCSTNYWREGDYVVDTFEVKAGTPTSPRATHKVYTGFYSGTGSGSKRLPVSPKDRAKADGQNRVELGSVKVR